MNNTLLKHSFLLVILLLFYATAISAQQTKEVPSPGSFFPKDRSKVLFVGSFHFHYPGLDAHVITENDKLDVLSASRQKELTDLVNYIKKFNPTKIAIEAGPDWQATKKFREYKTGAHRLERDERYQLGMRIAAEMKLDTIYSIDDDSMVSELRQVNPDYVKALFKDYDYKSDDKYTKMYGRFYASEDKLRIKMSLLAFFKHINSRIYHQVGYGSYLVGDFRLDDKRGADALAINWYSRNLRIFRNLQNITESAQDRILVIFGNGHASILRQLLESSPEYQWIEFNKLK